MLSFISTKYLRVWSSRGEPVVRGGHRQNEADAILESGQRKSRIMPKRKEVSEEDTRGGCKLLYYVISKVRNLKCPLFVD